MHFYCFLPYLHLISQIFLRILRILWLILSRPSRNSNLVPRLAVVGVVLLAILTDRQQPANKNTLDYDVVPADGVEPPQRPCRARVVTS